MHNKISPGMVESILRLDWSNHLKEQIADLQKSGLTWDESKAIIRKRLGFSKDQLNSHLSCKNTIEINSFIYACTVLRIVYLIDADGYSKFMPADSINSCANSMRQDQSKVNNKAK